MTSSSEVQASAIRIVRVYSSGIECKDFQGPKYNSLAFNPLTVDGQCKDKFKANALHHIIREENPKIKEFDKKFEHLKNNGVIPSSYTRINYRKLVMDTSVKVLKGDVDIVLCTCNEAGSYRIANSVIPEYCIIDECAMATEPECMVAIGRAKKVILIGDHKQLQPVLRSNDAINMGMSKSLFERYVNLKAKPHMLKVQYRMVSKLIPTCLKCFNAPIFQQHETLCEFPSHEFYQGELKAAESVALTHAKYLDKLARFWPQGRDTPMMLCDIVGVEEESHTGSRGFAKVGLESKRNTAEAEQVVSNNIKEIKPEC